MHIKAKVLQGVYADSMTLMALSTKINELPGVDRAMIGMGTDMNKEVIREAGMMTPEVEAATTSDMIQIIRAENEEEASRLLDQIEEIRLSDREAKAGETTYSNINQAVESQDNSSLVVISVPGQYAADEARKALELGKNVMIFSDNVAVEDELSLKQYAHEKGLLVMGPDCGTAIINGTGLCFANEVNRGPIGIVAASGTGAQELSTQIDHMGSGISQLVGVGGRDLSEEIGGIMMLDGMNMLAGDSNTEVIVLLSKPPADSVAEKVLAAAKNINKPVVICFIGDEHSQDEANLTFTHNTLQAAQVAVEKATGNKPEVKPRSFDVANLGDGRQEQQRFVRGLFCGGTICDEVFYVLKGRLDNVFSNVAKNQSDVLPVGEKSHDHSMIDLGSDEFTRGRPHPMIDPTIRNGRIVEESRDPEVAAILLDFVLGYGSHEDPVGASVSAIEEAKNIAQESGRKLEFFAYVLGTDKDPQNKEEQIAKLKNLGVHTVDSVVDLGVAALEFVEK